MPIRGSDRVKIIAFERGFNTYLFEAGRVRYRSVEDRKEWQLSSLEHDFAFKAVDFSFTIFLGYLDQQLNGDSSHTLADTTGVGQAPAVGVVDVLNWLKESNITPLYYYPKMEDSYGVVDMTKYRVITNQDKTDLLSAERAGRFTPYAPVSFKCKIPLQDYPQWANR